jgi:hypothetical protein
MDALYSLCNNINARTKYAVNFSGKNEGNEVLCSMPLMPKIRLSQYVILMSESCSFLSICSRQILHIRITKSFLFTSLC